MELSDLGDSLSVHTDRRPVFDLDLLDRAMPMTPREQAKRLGLNRTHWLNLRGGRKTASLGVALVVSEVSEIPVNDLWKLPKTVERAA